MPPITPIAARLTSSTRSWLFQFSPSSSFLKPKPYLRQFRWNSSSNSEPGPPLRPIKPLAYGKEAQAPSVVPQPLNLLTRVSNGSAFLAGASPVLGAAFTTVIGLAVAFVGGIFYFEWYKANVSRKIEKAFKPGYDPALKLADHGVKIRNGSTSSTAEVDWASAIRRQEQAVIDEIVHGIKDGYYIFLMGSKGVGKTTMIMDAMRRVAADGISICEAHEDLEVFWLRLGKALNYEYNEDSQTGLFHRRGPREGGPRLDIERALNKLEKVALKMAAKRKKPLVLVINKCQFLNNDEESRQLLRQLQQKAERWAEGQLITVVFCSDDFWPYLLLRQSANRMRVISVKDLRGQESLAALRYLRHQHFGKVEDDSVLLEALKTSGGRLSCLDTLSREENILEAAQHMLNNEKGWILTVIGLIPDCDDDVINEQKVCASSWSLLREFVRKYREREEELKAAAKPGEPIPVPELPAISYHEAKQIMGRADFIETLDRLNIINIDTDHMVQPDSMVVLKAAIEIVEGPGFNELLDGFKDRIDAIESPNRLGSLREKPLTT
ncbi:hypothetical protein FRC01_008193 [Tulasnella sp. 417]|nr:hypothetical protein FRC01_008193 [Tulasnella sp. 417]